MKRYWCLDSELCFYHVIIKVPDNTYDNEAYAFDSFHKKKLRDLFFWLEGIYCIECVNYCVMSTHAHFVICYRRDALQGLSLKEVAKRHQLYHKLAEPLDARSREIRLFKQRLNDLSDFMGNVEKRFTRWYNKQFDTPRRGQLWNHNFKAIHLKDAEALIRCLQYVELNPVRAQIVQSPEDYSFTSWADICSENPRAEKLKAGIIRAIRCLGEYKECDDDNEIFCLYAESLLMITEAIKEYGDIKRLRGHLVEALLQQHPYWSSGRALSVKNDVLCIETTKRRRFVDLCG